MTAKHPYPPHVVAAVAEALWEVTEGSAIWSWGELGDSQTRDYQYTKANTALQALWDASRVDDLPQVEVLPDDAVIQSADGLTEFARTMKYLHSANAYPAHVIYWGNHA